ncbi:MAG: hypothetical protein WBC97_11130 [Gemmatimonadales bacterium]
MRLSSCIRPVLAASLLAATTGCVTARLTDVWKDPGLPAAPLTHLMVVSLAPSEILRRTWEDAMVVGLKGHGVDATASYDIWPGGPPDIDSLAPEVQREAFDGVVLTHPADVKTSRTYVHGGTALVPTKVYDKWKQHYVTYYRQVKTPGHVEVSRSLLVDTDVWMAADTFRMVWTATTKAMNPTSTEATNKAIINALLPRLSRQGVIPPTQGK